MSGMHFYSTVENLFPEKYFVWWSWVNEKPKSHEIVQITTELRVHNHTKILQQTASLLWYETEELLLYRVQIIHQTKLRTQLEWFINLNMI